MNRPGFRLDRFSRSLVNKRSESCREYLSSLASQADVRFEGERPWDMQVHDERLWHRILAEGSIGAGEAYMDGWWDCEQLDGLFTRLLRAGVNQELMSIANAKLYLAARLKNLQAPSRAREVAHRHYNLSPELYRSMLDRRMIYSCGYWADAGNLNAAQEAKLSLVCKKLDLKPGMHLLDIGCGWGGAARFAAERFGVRVTGVTVSETQAQIAAETCAHLPVKIRVADYRSLRGRYDRIMSIGMFEHVGYKNYRTYFQIARDILEPDGLFLLHTIGGNRSATTTDPWIERYIFPNSMLPSAAQITAAINDRFVIEDWHNFGADYDRTLLSWHANFSRHWHQLADQLDERFQRMWTYYLLSSAGAFRARSNQLWQLVLSPRGLPGGWRLTR